MSYNNISVQDAYIPTATRKFGFAAQDCREFKKLIPIKSAIKKTKSHPRMSRDNCRLMHIDYDSIFMLLIFSLRTRTKTIIYHQRSVHCTHT